MSLFFFAPSRRFISTIKASSLRGFCSTTASRHSSIQCSSFCCMAHPRRGYNTNVRFISFFPNEFCSWPRSLSGQGPLPLSPIHLPYKLGPLPNPLSPFLDNGSPLRVRIHSSVPLVLAFALTLKAQSIDSAQLFPRLSEPSPRPLSVKREFRGAFQT